MLEQYYIKPETVDRIRESWIVDPIEQYVTWLYKNQYSATTIHHHVPILMHFGDFSRVHGAETWEQLPMYIEAFVDKMLDDHTEKYKNKEAKRLVVSAIRVPIQQMLELVLSNYSKPPRKRERNVPFSDQAPNFFIYLDSERGLRPNTIKLYHLNLRRFEHYLKGIGLTKLKALSPAVLSAFVTQSAQALCKTTLKSLCEQIRIFLRYLYREKIIINDLGKSLDAPLIYRLSNIPRSISWEEVGQLLDAVDVRTPLGKRDYAILLLLVTYGLRSLEVSRLSLESFDWKNERLIIPERKAGHSTTFPLSPIVAESIINYLQYGRPKSNERSLFLRSIAPYTPLSWEAIGQRVTRYLRKAEIDVARPGSHTLRHTCVQRLVDAHFSLKTIGDYVGHSTPISTQVYTKIDVEALREIACGNVEDVL